ncbi:MAG: hypothetical protein ACK2U9_05420, partial [Anaerolineae bacterium]
VLGIGCSQLMVRLEPLQRRMLWEAGKGFSVVAGHPTTGRFDADLRVRQPHFRAGSFGVFHNVC